ncbi:MAG: sensor histidine kinase [Methanomassiliicoccales archaeon]
MDATVALVVCEDIFPAVVDALEAEGLGRVEVILFPGRCEEVDFDHALLVSLLESRPKARSYGLVATRNIGMEEGTILGVPCRALYLKGVRPSEITEETRTELRSRLSSFVWQAMAEVEAESYKATKRNLERTRSDYAAVLDIMKKVATVKDEGEVVNTVLDLFVTLFSPRAIWYASTNGPNVVAIYAKGETEGQYWDPSVTSNFCRSLSYSSTESGFHLRIEHMGSTVGLMEVCSLAFPGNRARYLDMARSIGPVFGLAISNARHFHELTKMRNEVVQLNESLNITNKITRHDVRNELVVAHGSIQLFQMKRDPARLDQALRSLDKIDRQLSQLKELDGMLSQGASLKETELRTVVEEVARNYPMRTTVLGSHAAEVDQALFSIMDNLFRNAMVHGKAENMNVTIREADGNLEVLVADDGKGIDPSVRDKIFQEGFSYGETKGTGIGLFIVSRTMARYGGSITVGPNSPKGTVFTLRLPLPERLERSAPPKMS